MKRNHSSQVVHGSLFAEAFFIIVLACLLVSCRPDTKLAMHGIPAGTYTIHHYKQKTTGGNTLADYTLAETETGKSLGDSEITSVAKSYTGFKTPSVLRQGDVINLFYDRKSVTYTFETGPQGWFRDGTTSRTITGLYGSSSSAPFDVLTTGNYYLDKWVVQGGTELVSAVFGYEDRTYQAEYVWVSLPADFVYIPAGTFMMGRNNYAHEVTLTRAYCMCNHEVTQGEYEQYCSYRTSDGTSNPNATYGDGNDYPVYYVSWYDAIVYCNTRSDSEGLTSCYSINSDTNPANWINQYAIPQEDTDAGYNYWNSVECDFTANGYRLPTLAEWERAARAGCNDTESSVWSGTLVEDELKNYAWYSVNAGSLTHVVKGKDPNSFGLFDMSGNVAEWCWDWNGGNSDNAAETDPTGPLSPSTYKQARGGDYSHNAFNSVVTLKTHTKRPLTVDTRTGFRVVRTIP